MAARRRNRNRACELLAGTLVRRALWFAGVPLAVLYGGVMGSLPVFVLGLAVPGSIVIPLSLVTGTLLATLLAGSVASKAGSDPFTGIPFRTRGLRFIAVFAVSLGSAVVALFLVLASVKLVGEFGPGANPVTYLLAYLPGPLLFTAASTVATWRLHAST